MGTPVEPPWQSLWCRVRNHGLDRSVSIVGNLKGRAPEIAKLVNISPISMVYGRYIYLVGGLEPWNFMFPNSWDDDPIWRSHIFQRVAQPPIRWMVSNMNFMFHFISGMSSFPSTNSYFSRWLLHHQPVYMNIAQKKSLTPGIHCLSSELDQFCASVAGCQTLWGTTVAMYPTKTSLQRRMVSIRGNYPKNSGSVRFLKYLICPDTVGAKHCETIIVFLCTKDM